MPTSFLIGGLVVLETTLTFLGTKQRANFKRQLSTFITKNFEINNKAFEAHTILINKNFELQQKLFDTQSAKMDVLYFGKGGCWACWLFHYKQTSQTQTHMWDEYWAAVIEGTKHVE